MTTNTCFLFVVCQGQGVGVKTGTEIEGAQEKIIVTKTEHIHLSSRAITKTIEVCSNEVSAEIMKLMKTREGDDKFS